MTKPYDNDKRIPILRVNVKKLNAEFLDRYIFKGRYPVRTKFQRGSIEIPGIYVDNPRNSLRPVGLNYYGTSYAGDYDNRLNIPQPSTTRGVSAFGLVTIDVLHNDPDERDLLFGEVIAAYCSNEGHCWFMNQRRNGIIVHGYNVNGSSETEFEQSLDGKVQYLYLSTLSIEFMYDIVTTQIQPYIRSVEDQGNVVIE